MSKIIAGTTLPTGFVVKTDNTGNLVFQTGASSLTGLTIDTAQNVSVNDASKLKIPGGASGQVLSTDGSGNLSWIDGGIGNSGAILTKYEFTATANQIVFVGSDDNGLTFAYSPGNLIVTVNGKCTHLYTANNGVAVVLDNPSTAGDIIIIYTFKRFVLADMVPASTGGTFNGSIQVNGTIRYTGPLVGNGSELTDLSHTQITTALGFTPYNATNPNSYISGITDSMVSTALGYTPYNSANPSGYLSSITGTMVSTALGYTPYSSANPAGYITSTALSPYATTASLNATIPTGSIILWYGSTATIPSGWRLCDGGSGTPDLRDRFVLGAGNSYGVGVTGGSKNATLVDHTHTASSTDQSTAHTHAFSATTNSTSISGTFPTASNPAYSSNRYSGAFSLGTTFGANGGEPQTNAVVNMNATHSHTISGTTDSSGSTHNHTITVNSAGSSATNANLPPYYALCYIMKV